MKIQPDLTPALQNTQHTAQQERSQATEDAIRTQGVAQTTVVPPQDVVQTATTVGKVEGTPIDVGAPPPAPAVVPEDTGASAGVYAENVTTAIGSAGDSPFSNPTADNLARAFLAQQVFSDRQDSQAEEELLTASTMLVQLAIANAKKEIARLEEELKQAQKGGGGGMFGGFFGTMFKVLDPIGSTLMESFMKPEAKTTEIQQKLDAAHKRLDSLIDNLMAMNKHLRQIQEARLKEGAEKVAEETTQVGPDGVPKGMKEKMKSAMGDALIALMGQEGVTLDQAVSTLTDRAVEVMEAHGIQVTDAVRAQVATSIRENLFEQPSPSLEAVKTGVNLVAKYSETTSAQATSAKPLIR